jgi:hypothetical protein
MKWFDDLRVFLNGKKTILTTIVGTIDYFGTHQGYWEGTAFREAMELCLFGIFLRQGIQKSGPVDAAPVVK